MQSGDQVLQTLRDWGQRAGRGILRGGEWAYTEYQRRSAAALRYEGYDATSRTCLGVLQRQIDELDARMESGNLTKAEQPVLSRLRKVKAEMETALADLQESGELDQQPSWQRTY